MKFFVELGWLALVIGGAVAPGAPGGIGGASMHNPFFCYMTDPIRPMTYMHSASTSYEAIRRFNFSTTNPDVSTCPPSRFWYIGRYGGRYPHQALFQTMLNFADSTIQAQIVSNYRAGRTSLCAEDFEAIRDWTRGDDFVIENASTTTMSGIMAMRNIAARFQQHYPDILTASYDRNNFHFRYTGSERTNTSIRQFVYGLFKEGGTQVAFEDVPERDVFLRPFDFCPLFDEEVANWDAQRIAFQLGPEIQEMLVQVSAKLGFHSNQLSFETVQLMWEWCRFETASSFETSFNELGEAVAWCAPFSINHHSLFEYFEDLGHYYFSGYGVKNQRLLENLNCGLLQDLLALIQSDNDSDTKARIFVSYTQEIQLMLVLFGSFRDTWPLHQHNFAQQSGRFWFTSMISPQASNLVVVRHDCDDGDHDLVFLLNERPIYVPGCHPQTGVCKVSVFLQRFQRFIGADCEALFCTSD